jgi:ABC-type antimicrobial peptide transport system permease subunit
MALGATPGDVQLAIAGAAMRVVAIGVVLGIGVALIVTRGVQSLLFATSARDAVTFVLVPTLLTLVAVAACWLPALRATRIEPMRALREE